MNTAHRITKRGKHQAKKALTKNCTYYAIYSLLIISLFYFLRNHYPVITGTPDIVYAHIETTHSSPQIDSDNVFAANGELAYVMETIARIFAPEGTETVVHAINCFYSESGLRKEAYNYNRNGTEDRGIAQVNSIWHMSPSDAHDIEKNIEQAYKIYKIQGWDAWYGKGCH